MPPGYPARFPVAEPGPGEMRLVTSAKQEDLTPESWEPLDAGSGSALLTL